MAIRLFLLKIGKMVGRYTREDKQTGILAIVVAYYCSHMNNPQLDVITLQL